MLLRRRASLLSASSLSRRAHGEAAASSIYATTGHRVLSTVHRLSLSRAMHTSSPQPTRAISPTADCKWKRGHPVTARSGVCRPTHQGSSARTPALPGQLVITDTPTLMGAREQIRQASTARHVTDSRNKDTEASTVHVAQRMHLWDSSKAIRFAPTAVLEAHHSTHTMNDGNPFSTDAPTVLSSELEQQSDHGKIDMHPGVESELPSMGEPASQISTTTNHSNDSDYVDDEDNNNVPEQRNSVGSAAEDIPEKHLPLAYQIPDDILRTAMLASSNTRASYWSTKFYRGPQGEALSTHYCKSMEVAERVAQYFLKEKVVGFDIEWKPSGNPASIKQNASLIQLACEDRIALFHISLFPGTTAQQLMPPSLRAVLESPEVYKVGVAVKGDFTRLKRYLGIHGQGVFELSRLHNLVEWHETDPSKVTNRLVGLATQVLQHLQLPLYKGGQLNDEPGNVSSVRESDWSQPLGLEQIHYAAADAYAGFRLYHVLEWKREQLRPLPPAIQLCDYDSKRVPRPKEPRKRRKPAGQPESTLKVVDGRPGEVVEQEQEEAEDEEGYETAPEEFMDSHQLEDPVPKSVPETSGEAVDVANDAAANSERALDLRTGHDHETGRTYKRVGRVNLTQLRGPDPTYPALPTDTIETATRPSADEIIDHSSTTAINRLADRNVHDTQSPEIDVDAGDEEFADPELDEALEAMVLDSAGKLRNDTVEIASDVKTEREGQVTNTSSSNLVEEDLELNNATPTNAATSTFKPSTILSEENLHTPEYLLATTWAQNYLQSTVPSPTSTAPSRIRATVPHLRAYHLWYHQKLSLEVIGKHLRDPPLSHSTVTSYIVQAISLERLEHEKESLKMMMMTMPSGLRKGRWKWLAEKVGALD